MAPLATLRVLVLLAIRSLRAHLVKTLIVGGILTSGTFLLVFGGTLLDNVERTMQDSITGSLVGHLQVFSAEAKDDLAFYGPAAASKQDLGMIPDFARVKREVEKLPHVKALVPMGREIGSILRGNDLERILAALREAVHSGDADQTHTVKLQVRAAMDQLAKEYQERRAVIGNPAQLDAAVVVIEHARSAEFWDSFDKDPLASLEYLDQKVAPLEAEGWPLFLPYVGTDLPAFAASFPGFEIVDGKMIPPGQRGLLLNKSLMEKQLKNKVARNLDDIHKARTDPNSPRTIAQDPALKEDVARTARQYRTVIYALLPGKAAEVEKALRTYLGVTDGDLSSLMESFLKVDDQNFDDRYKFFYDSLAPRMRLYDVGVGEVITIRAIAHSGYQTAKNLRVYGTYRFKGLEDSAVASGYNLMDLMSFRDLYGLMTPEKKKEIDAIRSSVGVKEVKRDQAEEALFGAGAEEVHTAIATTFADPEIKVQTQQIDERPFDQADLESGVVLNAAVILDDPSAISRVRTAITDLNQREHLGLKIIDWQQAAGLLGQLILVLRGVLYVVIFIIFLVALVIINNSMLIATMDRVQEIGTMRAMGAQRSFVLLMVLLETVVLGVLSAGLGTGVAESLIGWLHTSGLSSNRQDILVLIFGGPRLFPHFDLMAVVVGLVAIMLVSLASTIYPARIATRVQPVVAMQRRE